MRNKSHISLVVIFALFFRANITILVAQNSYQTDMLAEIATSLNLKAELDTLKDGEYVTLFSHQDLPLRVIVKDSSLTHIGYLLFPDSNRRALAALKVSLDFVERSLLTTKIPSLNQEKSVEQRLKELGVSFSIGDFATLYKQVGDTSATVLVETLADKWYKISWLKREKTICSVTFPIDYDLLQGTDMVENERRLPLAIKKAKVLPCDTTLIHPKDLIKPKDVAYYVLQGDSCYTAELTSNRYYERQPYGNLELMYNLKYPIESLANLLTTVDIPNNFNVKVRLRKYDAPIEYFEVPLMQLVSYFLYQGCTPYFGEISTDHQVAVCELLMLNRAEGYCHAIKLRIDLEQLKDKEGLIAARLTSYIPTSKIKNLFDEE